MSLPTALPSTGDRTHSPPPVASSRSPDPPVGAPYCPTARPGGPQAPHARGAPLGRGDAAADPRQCERRELRTTSPTRRLAPGLTRDPSPMAKVENHPESDPSHCKQRVEGLRDLCTGDRLDLLGKAVRVKQHDLGSLQSLAEAAGQSGRNDPARLDAGDGLAGVKPEFHHPRPVPVRQDLVVPQDFAAITGFQGPQGEVHCCRRCRQNCCCPVGLSPGSSIIS